MLDSLSAFRQEEEVCLSCLFYARSWVYKVLKHWWKKMKYFHTLGSSSQSFIAISLPTNSLSGPPNEDPVCLNIAIRKRVLDFNAQDIFFHL